MSAGGIGEGTLLHDLQQQTQHLRVGFLDLIQQHQAVGAAANRLGQLAALIVADIAGRRADEPGHGVLFHIFRHIQPQHGILAAINLRGQSPAQLCFSHAGGTGKQQAGDGSACVPNAGKTPADGLRHSLHRFGLPHDVGREQPLQIQEPFPLPCRQPSHRNARPGRDHQGNVRPGHRPGPLAIRRALHKALHLVPELCRPLKPALPHGLPQFLLQLFPGGGAPGAEYALHFRPGRSLVQQVNGLVRKIEVRKIPDGQPDRLLQRLLRNAQPVVLLQPGLQGPENFHRSVVIRLLHIDRAKPPLQGSVLFDILPVLLPGGGPNHLQLSPTKGGL